MADPRDSKYIPVKERKDFKADKNLWDKYPSFFTFGNIPIAKREKLGQDLNAFSQWLDSIGQSDPVQKAASINTWIQENIPMGPIGTGKARAKAWETVGKPLWEKNRYLAEEKMPLITTGEKARLPISKGEGKWDAYKSPEGKFDPRAVLKAADVLTPFGTTASAFENITGKEYKTLRDVKVEKEIEKREQKLKESGMNPLTPIEKIHAERELYPTADIPGIEGSGKFIDEVIDDPLTYVPAFKTISTAAKGAKALQYTGKGAKLGAVGKPAAAVVRSVGSVAETLLKPAVLVEDQLVKVVTLPFQAAKVTLGAVGSGTKSITNTLLRRVSDPELGPMISDKGTQYLTKLESKAGKAWAKQTHENIANEAKSIFSKTPDLDTTVAYRNSATRRSAISQGKDITLNLEQGYEDVFRSEFMKLKHERKAARFEGVLADFFNSDVTQRSFRTVGDSATTVRKKIDNYASIAGRRSGITKVFTADSFHRIARWNPFVGNSQYTIENLLDAAVVAQFKNVYTEQMPKGYWKNKALMKGMKALEREMERTGDFSALKLSKAKGIGGKQGNAAFEDLIKDLSYLFREFDSVNRKLLKTKPMYSFDQWIDALQKYTLGTRTVEIGKLHPSRLEPKNLPMFHDITKGSDYVMQVKISTGKEAKIIDAPFYPNYTQMTKAMIDPSNTTVSWINKTAIAKNLGIPEEGIGTIIKAHRTIVDLYDQLRMREASKYGGFLSKEELEFLQEWHPSYMPLHYTDTKGMGGFTAISGRSKGATDNGIKSLSENPGEQHMLPLLTPEGIGFDLIRHSTKMLYNEIKRNIFESLKLIPIDPNVPITRTADGKVKGSVFDAWFTDLTDDPRFVTISKRPDGSIERTYKELTGEGDLGIGYDSKIGSGYETYWMNGVRQNVGNPTGGRLDKEWWDMLNNENAFNFFGETRGKIQGFLGMVNGIYKTMYTRISPKFWIVAGVLDNYMAWFRHETNPVKSTRIIVASMAKAMAKIPDNQLIPSSWNPRKSRLDIKAARAVGKEDQYLNWLRVVTGDRLGESMQRGSGFALGEVGTMNPGTASYSGKMANINKRINKQGINAIFVNSKKEAEELTLRQVYDNLPKGATKKKQDSGLQIEFMTPSKLREVGKKVKGAAKGTVDALASPGSHLELGPRKATAIKSLTDYNSRNPIGKAEFDKFFSTWARLKGRGLNEEQFKIQMYKNWMPSFKPDGTAVTPQNSPELFKLVKIADGVFVDEPVGLGYGLIDSPEWKAAEFLSHSVTLDFQYGSQIALKYRHMFAYLVSMLEGPKQPFKAIGLNIDLITRPVKRTSTDDPFYEWGDISEQFIRLLQPFKRKGATGQTRYLLNQGPLKSAMKLAGVLGAYRALSDFNWSFEYDGIPVMNDVSKYIRDKSIFIITGFQREETGDLKLDKNNRPIPNVAIFVPKKRDFAAFFNTVDFFDAALRTDEEVQQLHLQSKRELGWDLFRNAFEESYTGEIPGPFAIKKLLSVYTGYDSYTDRPLISEYLKQEEHKAVDTDKYDSNTPTSMRYIAEKINPAIQDVFGLVEKVTFGALDPETEGVSPAWLDATWELLTASSVREVFPKMADKAVVNKYFRDKITNSLVGDLKGTDVPSLLKLVEEYKNDMTTTEQKEFMTDLPIAERELFKKLLKEPELALDETFLPFWDTIKKAFYGPYGGGMKSIGRERAEEYLKGKGISIDNSHNASAIKFRRQEEERILDEQKEDDRRLEIWVNDPSSKEGLSGTEWKKRTTKRRTELRTIKDAIKRNPSYKNSLYAQDNETLNEYYKLMYTAGGTVDDLRGLVPELLNLYYQIGETLPDDPNSTDFAKYDQDINNFKNRIKADFGSETLAQLERSIEASKTDAQKMESEADEEMKRYFNIGSNIDDLYKLSQIEGIEEWWQSYLNAPDKLNFQNDPKRNNFKGIKISALIVRRKQIRDAFLAQNPRIERRLIFFYGGRFFNPVTRGGAEYHNKMYQSKK